MHETYRQIRDLGLGLQVHTQALCVVFTRSSEEEHKADALALGAEEGRDKLRKAAVRSKYPLTRRCPNGGTHLW